MLVGKSYYNGFSTLELLIALAILVTVIVGAVDANIYLQYWRLTTTAVPEALQVATTRLIDIQQLVLKDFQSIVSGSTPSECATSAFCYYTDVQVDDISPCAKNITVASSWKIGVRYPTSSVVYHSKVIAMNELVAWYGDCRLTTPAGNWALNTPSLFTRTNYPAQFTSDIDVFEHSAYIVASSAPQLRIYREPAYSGESLIMVGSSTILGNRVNAIDVVRNMTTGRLYAYIMQHTPTEQLVVLDVTKSEHPTVVSVRTLSGVFSDGSFPQGWRVLAYGDRLYVVTRETAGPELHIFNIAIPDTPTEITGAVINLGRTVNDMAIHEQKINNQIKRYLILAASAATKELTIIDVTEDLPRVVVTVDLPGTADASSLSVVGKNVYLGRKNSSGPELYRFDMLTLLSGNTVPVATSEVGADVT